MLAGALCCVTGGGAAVAAPGPSRTTLVFSASLGAGGANHFLLRRSGRCVQLVDLDTGRVLRQREFARTKAVSIAGANGHVDNTLTIDFSGGSLAMAGGIAFDGGLGGYNTLRLRGGHAARERAVAYGPHAGLLNIDGATIRYTHIAPITDTTPSTSETVSVSGPAINIVDGTSSGGTQTTQINDGGTGSFELINFANKAHVTVDGSGGDNSFVLNNPNPAAGLQDLTLANTSSSASVFNVVGTAVPLTVVGGSIDTVNLGLGDADEILSPVSVSDPSSHIALDVDDSSDPTGRTASISTDGTTDTISGLAPATIKAAVSDLASVTVSGGTGDNAFTVSGTGANTPATLNTGAGDDTTNVSATQTGGPLAIHGQNGNDAVNIGATGSVQGIAAGVSVDNTLGETSLTLDDSTDMTARAVRVTPASVIGLAPSAITYADVPALTVKGGGPSDAFTVVPSTTTTDSLLGGAATPAPRPGDTLTMSLSGITAPTLSGVTGPQGVAGTWSFEGDRPVDFSAMQTLNPTALSIGDASATVSASAGAPLVFTASLLAPSTQVVSAAYATSDATATAAAGAYQPANGTVTFAPGTTSQPITVSALGDPTVRPVQTFLLNLASPVGALLSRPTGTGTITDTTPAPPKSPSVVDVGVTPRSFTLTGRNVKGRCVKRAPKDNRDATCQLPIALRVSYTLNVAASVTFTLKRNAPGRKVKGRCVKATAKNRKHRRCTRLMTLTGTIAQSGKAGANHFTFNGKIGGHKLGPGNYQLTATPVGGNPQAATFTIVR